MRDLSDDKPVGVKLCVGHIHDVMAVMKFMLKTGILLEVPDETPCAHGWRAADADSFQPAIQLEHVCDTASQQPAGVI